MKKTNESKQLNALRHSAAHLLAHAVKLLYPGALNAIGPAIENGFYQDFDMGKWKVSEEDLPKIEAKMRQILPTWQKFSFKEVSLAQAEALFKDNKYKVAMAREFAQEGKKLMINDPGDFLDLCKMEHMENPSKELKHFKLLSVAGAYWRGSEKNPMLTRIYGTAFFSQEDLDKHMWQLEEAKKRDHRKLGKELELFAISDQVGPGLILWLPKGNILKEELENWAKEVEAAWGYQRVSTPTITKAGLYYTSGHLPYYKSDMFPPMTLDKEEYYLKPMNCPHHHMIYKARPRSYKELPLRLAEYGMCHRYEASGELFGLMRVRGLDMNDAHIYCSLDQAVEEFAQVMRLHEHYYRKLGITDYHLEMALRDPKKKDKYHGDEKMWARAEKLMRQAVAKVDIKMVEEEGSAAFYGPKIDFIVHSSVGREFAISTNQIDLYMGSRFGLTYTNKDGKEQTPVIIHRAPLGSHERFIGFLIEHFAGAFPTWLSPVQVVIIPISQEQNKYSENIYQQLIQKKIRVENWNEAESMQKRIRRAENQKIPYMLIVGQKEIESTSVSVRARGEKDEGKMPIENFVKRITNEIKTKRIN